MHTPAYSQLAGALTYLSPTPLPAGSLVRVPLGQRETLGVVWEPTDAGSDATKFLDVNKLRPVSAVLDALPPLTPHWRALIRFAASYYQRSAGEVALAALPPQLRDLSSVQLARKLKKLAKAAAGAVTPAPAAADSAASPPGDLSPLQPHPDNNSKTIALSAEQTSAIGQFNQHPGPFLLFGATGSGKTEVFMHCTAQLLARQPQAQVLVMVPEINLTPQLEERFKARFEAQFDADAVVSLHSGMSPAQRLNSWLAAHSGAARIVLGTRMAVFASMPTLQLIIVDEEHDPSYKSHEGARYSARDLAIYRGHLEGIKVMLGSATPSLESWYHSRPQAEGGRYLRLDMPSRIGQGQLPLVRRVDMAHQPKGCIIAAPLLAAIAQRVARGEQSMLFLNRRGYAPVLECTDCGWQSTCPNCSAFRVFHKIDRTLRCHHCGLMERVPSYCPTCGNADISPVGRGTERLEEHLSELLADIRRPDGQPVRVVRIDADTTKLKGALQAQLAQVHSGDVDVLVGTQMIAKGHDFRRITLVAAVNPDNALFSSDFRAPERLFSLLMQAAGRAGRDAAVASRSEMWLQTTHPTHPLYEALKNHDYPAFAASQLKERLQAGMPPMSFQALVRADARSQEVAQGFLNAASLAATQHTDTAALLSHLTLYPAVPMTIARVANVERAQMLIESPSRTALQRFLTAWQGVLHSTRSAPECKGLMRWAIDVDPLLI
ncbi:primosomal protein N' [Rhodoferax sp.]|uniref:replication restart helicase PriA n=1 Tax=Rhodoferax sp. TaxID=50421 RepID=UPI0026080229|nr:primosomal protein N' [Rhodoferax sp.]MDD2809326.1 primosomal protein N' [Rhodoferax sp.]